METEEAVQIDDGVAWDVDGWSHRIVSLLAVRNHDVETVSRATLENDDEAFVARAGLDRGVSGAGQERRDRSRADDCEGTVPKEYSASDGHRDSSWLLAKG